MSEPGDEFYRFACAFWPERVSLRRKWLAKARLWWRRWVYGA